MSYADEYTALAAHFSGYWESSENPLYPNTGIAWNDASYHPAERVPFVRFSRLSGTEAQIGICGAGGGAYRNAGVISLQIFTPRGDGGALSRTAVDYATGIFRGQVIGAVKFGSIEITDNIEDADSAWYGVSISFYYQRWEVHQ
jgi:hypothetical protein